MNEQAKMLAGKLYTACLLYTSRDNDVMNTHISNLRKKLGDEGWRIETIWGLGYRFIKD